MEEEVSLLQEHLQAGGDAWVYQGSPGPEKALGVISSSQSFIRGAILPVPNHTAPLAPSQLQGPGRRRPVSWAVASFQGLRWDRPQRGQANGPLSGLPPRTQCANSWSRSVTFFR